MRFSSDRYAESDRRESWERILARKLLHVDVQPLSDAPYRAHASLRLLPGLRFGAGNVGASVNSRGRAILRDDNDDFSIVINLEGSLMASQRGREIALEAGDAYLMACAEDGVYARPARGHLMLARFPHRALAPMVPGLYDRVARPIPRTTEALRLLTSYFRVLEDNQALATPELRELVTRHCYDLIALVLNPTREQIDLAGRGLRAGRLSALKSFVHDNLTRHDLSVQHAAQKHRLSPRQVQRLFEGEGMTFSEYVQQERLRRVHGELIDPLSKRSISDIAYDAGFGDISHFNRAFRRRYGASPSEVRHRDVVTLEEARANARPY
ncbi:MAG TPA: AraC family transcriptional regulator [Rhizomicrobium sp.]|nr:AraC family transcriptional regulator [Rhizomicrobium sp.]